MDTKTLNGLLLVIAIAVTGCGKTQLHSDPDPIDPSIPVTTGNTTNYNGYIVKTVGVNMMWVGVDDNYKITNVQISGGGNKIIFKAGKGNVAEISNDGLSTCPDNLTSKPDGTIHYMRTEVDNGKVLDTIGSQSAVLKLKGFDKSKTGYNQINIVFCDYLVEGYQTGGYYNNVIFTRFKKQAGKNNADYGTTAFIKQLFNGEVNVTSVEIAPPLSEKTYVVEDQIISSAGIYYDFITKKGNDIKLDGFRFQFEEVPKSISTGPLAPRGLKAEWVNAGKATYTNSSNVYSITFEDMKNGIDQVIDPIDTLTRPFIRISGFDRKKSGFDQLRLFIADDGIYKGMVRVFSRNDPATAPTVAEILKAFSSSDMTYFYATPIWPHY